MEERGVLSPGVDSLTWAMLGLSCYWDESRARRRGQMKEKRQVNSISDCLRATLLDFQRPLGL